MSFYFITKISAKTPKSPEEDFKVSPLGEVGGVTR